MITNFPLLLVLQRRGEVVGDRPTDSPTTGSLCVSFHSHYERLIVDQHCFPPLWSKCSVALLWKWAKRGVYNSLNVTPSYGQNGEALYYICTAAPRWASPWPRWCQLKGEMKNIADWRNSGPIVILSVYAQCQTIDMMCQAFKINYFTTAGFAWPCLFLFPHQ